MWRRVRDMIDRIIYTYTEVRHLNCMLVDTLLCGHAFFLGSLPHFQGKEQQSYCRGKECVVRCILGVNELLSNLFTLDEPPITLQTPFLSKFDRLHYDQSSCGFCKIYTSNQKIDRFIHHTRLEASFDDTNDVPCWGGKYWLSIGSSRQTTISLFETFCALDFFLIFCCLEFALSGPLAYYYLDC